MTREKQEPDTGLSAVLDALRAPGPISGDKDLSRILFENTGTAMCVVGEDAVIHRCNSQFAKVSGYPVPDVEGKMKWTDFIVPDDLPRMEAYHRLRSRDNDAVPTDYTFSFKDRDGSRRRAHISIRLLPETGVRICSFIDITSHMRTLEALRLSEERYLLVSRGATDGFWDWDIQTGDTWFSPRYKAILGYSDEEFPNRTESWLERIHPDDFERAMSAHQRCMDGEVEQFEVEYRMFHKDGTVRWILGRGAGVRDAAGKTLRMAGTHTDITQRKFNERTTNALYAISSAISTTRDLRELYETIHRIIDEAIDADNFFITLLNEETDSLEFVYFVDERDDYYTISDVGNPEKNSLTIHVFRTGVPMLLSASNPRDVERMDGIGIIGTLPESWLGVPLRLRGTMVGAMAVQDYEDPKHYNDPDVAFMTAVSEQVALAIERKRNEEDLELKVDQRTRELREKAAELEEANARLRELDKIKSSLVSSVSHELRTPLTSIRGFAKLCSKDFSRYFDDMSGDSGLISKAVRIRNNLEIIDMEGDRLTRLINDFLDINRIESGMASWHDRRIDLCEVVRKAVTAASGGLAAKTNIRIELDLPESATPIHADPDKIQQVVLNLLGNAYKFTREGKVTVSLTEVRGTLTTSVHDTGPGIPEAELPRLFEKFHQFARSDTVTNEERGTGLGLAICKEIVEHYGGAIRVESTVGRGSCFSFSLPTA
ncbi:MAG: PAS domain-containing protein [Desulfovibrionaceae bacterium]|nr:PAS domain-containing protein [Desulfovibrionaceae bacterium]